VERVVKIVCPSVPVVQDLDRVREKLARVIFVHNLVSELEEEIEQVLDTYFFCWYLALVAELSPLERL
jgi:hypothetical protein